MTIFSGQLLALLLMNGFNKQTTSLYRNCNTSCAEFSKTIFADFLEMNHCFDLAGWIVQCLKLEDFMSVLPFQIMRGSRKKKGLLSSYWNIENNGSSLKLLGGGCRGNLILPLLPPLISMQCTLLKNICTLF